MTFKCTACGAKAHEPYCEEGCDAPMREIETKPVERDWGYEEDDLNEPRDEPIDALDAALDPHGPWGAP